MVYKNSSQLSPSHSHTGNESRRRSHHTSQVERNKQERSKRYHTGLQRVLQRERKQATATNTIINRLRPFTDYCIKVTGYTKVGESPQGNCVFLKTLDSGKLQCFSTCTVYNNNRLFPNASLHAKQVLIQNCRIRIR